MQKTIKIDVASSTPLWPYEVVQVIEDVMQEGKRKGKNGWERQPTHFHIGSAEQHLMAIVHGDVSEDHLTHAFCRLMMAIAIERGYVGKGDE